MCTIASDLFRAVSSWRVIQESMWLIKVYLSLGNAGAQILGTAGLGWGHLLGYT